MTLLDLTLVLNKGLFQVPCYLIYFFFKLFNSLISPILQYGSEVWSPFQMNGLNDSNFVNLCDKIPVENINTSFCKYLLGIHKYASNYAVKGELGSWGLGIESICHAVKYWLRIYSYDQDSLLYKSYLENYQNLLNKPSTQNWCSYIRLILNKFDLMSVWQNQESRRPHKVLKQRMYLLYEHTYLEGVHFWGIIQA